MLSPRRVLTPRASKAGANLVCHLLGMSVERALELAEQLPPVGGGTGALGGGGEKYRALSILAREVRALENSPVAANIQKGTFAPSEVAMAECAADELVATTFLVPQSVPDKYAALAVLSSELRRLRALTGGAGQ